MATQKHTKSGGVLIRKSPPVVVAPSETVSAITGDISLSRNEKLMLDYAVTVLLVYEHPIQEPVESIKRALSQALVHYYPLAGRFATGATAGDVVIKCTGEGVRYVAASASCAIKDVERLADPALQKELAIFYPAAASTDAEYEEGEYYSQVDPLVLLQCTVFSCGGFILGLTFKHAAADGVGICQFMQAVGELARGLPSPSVVPVRQDDSLVQPDLLPFCRDLFQLMRRVQPSQMSTLDITVKPSLVNHIKDKYASINSGRPCTVFEAVAAVLWRCRTRAIRAAPEALAVLTFSVSVRKHVGAKNGYYGNCGTTWAATASSGAVVNGDMMNLVKAIRGAKDGLAPKLMMPEGLDPYNHLMMTCWRNLGIEALDFGGGTPARVRCHWPKTVTHPFCIACLPCKDDEYSVLSVCVKEEHAGAFLHELAHMHLNYSSIRSVL